MEILDEGRRAVWFDVRAVARLTYAEVVELLVDHAKSLGFETCELRTDGTPAIHFRPRVSSRLDADGAAPEVGPGVLLYVEPEAPPLKAWEVSDGGDRYALVFASSRGRAKSLGADSIGVGYCDVSTRRAPSVDGLHPTEGACTHDEHLRTAGFRFEGEADA